MKHTPDRIKADAELIDALGGPAALAKLLNMKQAGARQCVQWWKTRGVPDSVKLEHPSIFLRDLKINRRMKLPLVSK